MITNDSVFDSFYQLLPYSHPHQIFTKVRKHRIKFFLRGIITLDRDSMENSTLFVAWVTLTIFHLATLFSVISIYFWLMTSSSLEEELQLVLVLIAWRLSKTQSNLSQEETVQLLITCRYSPYIHILPFKFILGHPCTKIRTIVVLASSMLLANDRTIKNSHRASLKEITYFEQIRCCTHHIPSVSTAR